MAVVAAAPQLRALARAKAQKYGLDPDLFERQIAQESAWDARATSRVGARGLGQLMPDTARELGVTDPTDPEQNLDAAARYMRQNLDRFGGDVKLALAAYNAGPGAVEKHGGVPPFPETQDYVRRVMGAAGRKLRDLMPPELLAKYPPESLKRKAAELLDVEIPDGYPPERAQAVASLVAQRLPRLVNMATLTAGSGREEGYDPGATMPLRADAGPGAPGRYSAEREPRLGVRFTRALAAALPDIAEVPPGSPEAQNYAEHLADFAGGAAGFIGTAGVATALTGSPHVGLAAAGALPAGTPKERGIRAGVNVALGAFAGVLGRQVAKKIGGGRKGAVAHHGVTAATFGAGAGTAERGALAATGEKVEWPSLGDLAREAGQGTAELGVLNLVLGTRGLVRPSRPRSGAAVVEEPKRLTGRPAPAGLLPPARERVLTTPPPAAGPSGAAIPLERGKQPIGTAPGREIRTMGEPAPAGAAAPLSEQHARIRDRVAASLPDGERATFEALFRPQPGASGKKAEALAAGVRRIARTLAEPPAPTPALRERAVRATADLNERVAGKTVRLNAQGVEAQATIVRVAVFPYPGEPRQVRMLAADPRTGELVALEFDTVSRFLGALGGSGVKTGRPVAAPTAAAIRQTEGKSSAPSGAARPGTTLEAQRAAVVERPTAQQRMTALESGVAEAAAKGDPRALATLEMARQASPEATKKAAAVEQPVAEAGAGALPAAPAAAKRVRPTEMAFGAEVDAQRMADIINHQNPAAEAVVVAGGRKGYLLEVNEAAFSSAGRVKKTPAPSKVGGGPEARGAEAQGTAAEPAPSPSKPQKAVEVKGAAPPAAPREAVGEKAGSAAPAKKPVTPSVRAARRAAAEARKAGKSPDEVRAAAREAYRSVPRETEPKGGRPADAAGREPAPAPPAQIAGKYAPGTKVFTPYLGKRKAKRTFDRGEVISYEAEGKARVRVSRGGGVRKGLSHSRSEPTFEEHVVDEALLRRQPKPKSAAEKAAAMQARGDRLTKNLSTSAMRSLLERTEGEAQESYEAAYGERSRGAEQQAAINRALRVRRMDLPAIRDALARAQARIDDAPRVEYEALSAKLGEGHPALEHAHRMAYTAGPGRMARHAEVTRDSLVDAALLAKTNAAGAKEVMGLLADDIRIAKLAKEKFSGEALAERLRGAKDPAAEWKAIEREVNEILGPPGPADVARPSGLWGADEWGGGMSAFGAGEVGRAIGRVFHRAVLRGIPRAQERMKRQVGRKANRIEIRDSRGNVRDTGEAVRWEADHFTESALHRLYALVDVGRSSLLPKLTVEYVKGESDRATLEREYFLRYQMALGPEAMAWAAPYMRGSRDLFRALEQSHLPHRVPQQFAHAVEGMRTYYDSILADVNEARVAMGMKPIKPRKGYSPHITVEQFADAYDDIFQQLAGRRMTPAELRELKNRHLEHREGDTKYLEDNALAAHLYGIRAARYITSLRFLKEQADFVRDNRDIDPIRAETVQRFIESAFFGEKGRVESYLDSVARMMSIQSGPDTPKRITKDVLARRLGVPMDTLKDYARVYSVPHGGKVRATDPTALVPLGEKHGFDHYGVTKGHLVPAGEFQLHAPLRGFFERRAKFKVRLKDMLSKIDEKVTRHPGGRMGFLDKRYYDVDAHEAAALAELHDVTQRYGHDPGRAWTAFFGRNQVRALLGGNISAVSQNSLQNLITSFPEYGLAATAKGMRAEARGTLEQANLWLIDSAESGGWLTHQQAEQYRKVARMSAAPQIAEALGSLQGELPRQRRAVLLRLAGADPLYRRLLDAMSPMSPYRGVEDLTRGADAVASAAYGARMGLSPIRARRIYEATQQSRIALMRALSKGVTDTRSAAAFVAQKYPVTMFDYGPLGQTRFHRTALGGWLGRLTTFPLNWIAEYEYRPLMGVGSLVGATVRGVARSLTGGRIGRKQPGSARTRFGARPGFRGEKFIPRSQYPPPQSKLEAWLREGGHGPYQQQGVKVFVRQLQLMGALQALSWATGLNWSVVGTAGYQLAMVWMLRQLTGDERLKKIEREMNRGAVVNYARGAVPLGPTISLAKQTFDAARSIPRRYDRLSKNDREALARIGHMGQAVSEALTPGFAEFGRQQVVPALLALRRSIEVAPEKFDAHPWVYDMLGIKTVYEGLSNRERWMRQHNLLKQERLDETKRAARKKESPSLRRAMPRIPTLSRGAA